MQSLDSSNKWSSRESLSSTPSFLYSESDQTEDEGDVFSEGEGGRAPLDRFSLAASAASPARRHSAGYYRDQRDSRAEGQLGGAVRRGQPPSPPAAPPSEGDLAFAQKCAELQGYLRPLLELLNGLKTGRFDKGLSTFQQSVAMDRLQRIVGVLQKPHLGEKYLRTLQQIEMMLKTWFPQVHPQQSSPPDRQNATPSPSAHWHQDQLHIPVKKRRRSSWSDSDSCSSIPPTSKRAHSHQCGQGIGSAEDTPPREESVTSKHSADLSPPADVSSHQGKQRRGGGVPPLVIPPSCVGNHTDTQDSFVSSTTPTSHMPHVPPAELQPLGRSSSSNEPDALKEGDIGEGKATGEHGQCSEQADFTNSSICSPSRGSENT